MLGFKNFAHGAITSSGIELAQKIRKGQFDTVRIRTGTGAAVADIRGMVIAA